MRLGFDVTPLLVPQSGIGTYTKNLLDHLTQAASGRAGRESWISFPLPTVRLVKRLAARRA